MVIDRPDWADHPDYATNEARFARREEIWSLLKPIFKSDNTSEWVDRLEAGGVPAGPIYSMDEVFSDPQVQHLEMAAPVHHHARGDTRVVAQPIRLSRTPAAVTVAAPDAGEHTDEILVDLGLSSEQIAGLRARNVI